MERKYRQRGYMDHDRPEKKTRPPKPQGPKEFRPRAMPGFRQILRCAMCGAAVPAEIELESQCPKCHADLRSCKHCAYFDTGKRNECRQPVAERVARKDVRNQCSLFEAKRSVERETTSSGGGGGGSVKSPAPPAPSEGRLAFDALFKK